MANISGLSSPGLESPASVVHWERDEAALVISLCSHSCDGKSADQLLALLCH